MQGNPHTESCRSWPRLVHQRDLHCTCSGYRVGRAHKDREPAVALPARPNYRPRMRTNETLDQLVVPSQRTAHGDGCLLPPDRAALNIGEQKRNRPCGEAVGWRALDLAAWVTPRPRPPDTASHARSTLAPRTAAHGATVAQ